LASWHCRETGYIDRSRDQSGASGLIPELRFTGK
jgi:hypothetical protein